MKYRLAKNACDIFQLTHEQLLSSHAQNTKHYWIFFRRSKFHNFQLRTRICAVGQSYAWEGLSNYKRWLVRKQWMETTAWRSPIEYSHHVCIECVADPITALSPGCKCWEKTEITIFSEAWNTFWFHRTAKVSRSYSDLNNFLTQLFYPRGSRLIVSILTLIRWTNHLPLSR